MAARASRRVVQKLHKSARPKDLKEPCFSCDAHFEGSLGLPHDRVAVRDIHLSAMGLTLLRVHLVAHRHLLRAERDVGLAGRQVGPGAISRSKLPQAEAAL